VGGMFTIAKRAMLPYMFLLENPIYNYNMCVRLSVCPTTVPRVN